MILAFHSSPHPEGNLERMVNAVAQASGLEHEIIRLAEMEIAPCTGCVRCARSKRCVQQDDMAPLYQKLEAARGLIVGGVNYNGRFNSIAHIFLERLFPLYHQEPALQGLPVAVVAVGGEEPERAGMDIAGYLKEIWMCSPVGMVLFKSDTLPVFPAAWGLIALSVCRPCIGRRKNFRLLLLSGKRCSSALKTTQMQLQAVSAWENLCVFLSRRAFPGPDRVEDSTCRSLEPKTSGS